jgi:sugar transferase (PEP-CTERM/EpsH1 system associated)
MKILFLAHRLPYPPDRGDKIRSFNILKFLSQTHDVVVACPIIAEDERYLEDIKRYCTAIDYVRINALEKYLNLLSALASGRSLSVAAFYNAALQDKITARLTKEKFDLIFAFSSQMARYVENIRSAKRVMDFVDVDSRKWLQLSTWTRNPVMKWLYRREADKLAQFEKDIAAGFDRSLFVSESEAQYFSRLAGNGTQVDVVHNGVDFDYFSPNGGVRNKTDILFTGVMDYYPNVDAVSWFVHKIFPLIKEQVPVARFWIVGRNPSKAVKRLHDGENVFVTGYVEDVRPYFEKCGVFVAPFRIACGVQNKILEALAMGLPVVATPIGAEGLISDSLPVDIATCEGDFSRCVTGFASQGYEHRNGANRSTWVKRYYSWEANLSVIDELITPKP